MKCIVYESNERVLAEIAVIEQTKETLLSRVNQANSIEEYCNPFQNHAQD